MIFSSPLRRRFAALLAFWLLLSPSGMVGAGVIVVRADELRNGYAQTGAGFYHQTALPSGTPFALNEAVDGGPMIADVAMVL